MVFGCALGDEVAAFGAGFGADVDEVIGFGEDVGVVLNDDNGVAFIDEAMEDVDEAFHVGHGQAEGWAGPPLPSFGLAEGWRQIFL